jgi:alpha-beta hydrolase superfamily lysophospholipase
LTTHPVMRVHLPDGPVRAAVLVLHGGRAKGTGSVPPWALAVLRMRPFTTALRHAGAGAGLAVVELRHVVRGWNGAAQSPVSDARWALEQMRERFGDVPIGLVGHSMGGRTALAVADEPGVRSIVALAPWIEAGDSPGPVTGRVVLIVHGTLDRMTDPRASAAFAERARLLAEQVTYLTISGERHAMLRRAQLWHELATGFTIGALLNWPLKETSSAEATKVVQQALAGEHSITV